MGNPKLYKVFPQAHDIGTNNKNARAYHRAYNE